MKDINDRGMVVIGCGFMGKALLEGWLKQGVLPAAIHVQDPMPSEWLLQQKGMHLNAPLPKKPAVLVIATKPQILDEVLPPLAHFGGGDTTVVSIVTGASVSRLESLFGATTPIVRAMPNLPATVGAGVTAYVQNDQVNDQLGQMVKELFNAVGMAIELSNEDQMHAVTGISGSGPAYIFAMAEAMTAAGVEMGLTPELSNILAVHTIAGAGSMMQETNIDASNLRLAVTSKGGTTAAALEHLLAPEVGLFELMKKTTNASRNRSIELSKS